MSAEIINLPAERPHIPTDYARMERPVCGRCTLLLAAVIVFGLPALAWLVELCGRLA